MNRLLSVNSYHYRRGGSDVVYLDHAALFERHGWKNVFFSMRHPKNQPYPLASHFAERVDYDDAVDTKARLINASRILYSQDARRRLGAVLDAHPIDIAHFHLIHHHLSPSVLVEAQSRGIPTVMTAHDLKLACPSYTMLNSSGICERCKGGRVWNVLRYRCIKGSFAGSALIMLESALHKALGLYSRNLSAIIAPSRFYRQKLIEWGWAPQQVHYIPNFVALPAIAQSGEYGSHVLYFGRLAPEKGLVTLIEASARSRVAVAIAGDGPEDARLRELARRLGAPVTFLGFLSGSSLWQAVEASRAVVLPSVWYENAPVSVLEAFARQRPVAGSKIGGIAELITPGETGWYFEPSNVEGLAATLAQIRDTSEAKLRLMGRNVRAFVDREFNEDRYYDAMCTLYKAVSLARTPFAGQNVNQHANGALS